MSYMAQPNNDCANNCPVILQDSLALRALGDSATMAHADYERHCTESQYCGGAIVRIANSATITYCPTFQTS